MSTNAGLPGNGVVDLPLSGLRVIDMAPGPLAPIGQHLVELGAEVIRVEPPGGCADRTGGEVFSRIGIGFAATNLGKRAIAINLSTAPGRLEFERLVQGADILLESARPGSDLARRIDVPGLLRRHPALVVLSATAFGQHGPQRDWHATGPIFDALSGVLSRSGLPGRAPLLLPGELAYACATAHAAYVVLLAYWNRLRTGRGDWLDLSLLEAAISALVAGKTRAVLDEEGQHWGVPVAGVRRMDEVVATPHFRARGAFASVEIAPGVKAAFPNGVFEVDGRRAGPRAGLPALEADPGWTQPRPAPTAPVDTGARPPERAAGGRGDRLSPLSRARLVPPGQPSRRHHRFPSGGGACRVSWAAFAG